jgi:alkylation response protein AidB-like acyl-CoA dehydrogenase
MVEKTPGPQGDGRMSISEHIDKLGYRGLETVEMSYVDHRIPGNSLLGGEEGLGQGFRWAMAALELGRINVAARGVGVAQAAFNAALDYAQQRETFGRPIAQHQAIAFKLAEMATKLHAARLMVSDAARRADAGERADMEAGMAKLFASETAAELALDAMRIHGGNGFTTEYSVERLYRDAPLMIIGEGTSEIQKLVISRALLARAADDR